MSQQVERLFVTITDGEKVIGEQIPAEVRVTLRGNKGGWEGIFVLPPGSIPPPPDAALLMTAEDGRVGRIMPFATRDVRHAIRPDQPVVVPFTGQLAFTKPE